MTPVLADITSSINSEALELQYHYNMLQITDSIADFGGNMMKRVNFKCIENNKVSIGELSKGIYTLCIIDEDQL